MMYVLNPISRHVSNVAIQSDGLWPWAARHTPQAWKNHYLKNTRPLEKRIVKELARARRFRTAASGNSEGVPKPAVRKKGVRNEFLRDDVLQLVRFFAIEYPSEQSGRTSEKVYKRLHANVRTFCISTRRSLNCPIH